MFVKIFVLVAAIAQVIAAAYLSIGTFEETERMLPVLIQPAGWAFSIWGLIYVLSAIYAVYQLVPKYDNETLRATRVPALVAFVGSIVWLYFAGMTNGLVWLTIPTLFIMAIALTYVVRAPESSDARQNFFSKYTLLPYAAWAGVACWINVQALLLDQVVVTNSSVNFATNLVLFFGLVVFTMYYFTQTRYNAWYGGVLVWASMAVAIVNYQRADWEFMAFAAAFAATVVGLYVKKRWIE